MSAVIVTGTDTGIGKTLFSAGLVHALGGAYWKPVQSGLDGETDSAVVRRLSGCPVLPEAYRLRLAASPHLSAEQEGVAIRPERLALPRSDRPLVVEAAGGLMVPLTRRILYLDVMSRWAAPVVLCCRTALGTINHSLLSLAALEAAGCRVAGVVFIGDEMKDSRRVICSIGKARDLGRLPVLPRITRETLSRAFAGIDVAGIRGVL
ncbi:dethiobiotin synthase [Pontibaca methylaminivorans]|uniref:ATP-dependent dethiobiotin synthetase BioD n=1 Tax=Pontibaca methylaminivorans TaxID=515897 RepID=A0A1R3X3K2_9RHOB|nr:dethiobiotin synthase [Pontibaca methylaminivorans]SIT84491.1 dethiobiotin synthetase [Pontibaca methylaminivorans]